MGMKKVFVSLGVGVMVVTGLIQSEVVDVVNEKLNQPPIASMPAQSQSFVSSGTASSSNVSSEPVGGVIVPGKIQEVKVKKSCTTLIAETTFMPGKETFLNSPLLATVEPGEYLVTAEGFRYQPFFVNGGEIPTYSRKIDTEGNLLNNSDGKITQFIVTSTEGRSFMTFPEKPYGMFLINTGTNNYPVGRSYSFTTKARIPVKMDLNVFQLARSYTGKGSFNVKLYHCKK